ncbi:MAG: DinB family protein [Verrucomicrobiota bacterium]
MRVWVPFENGAAAAPVAGSKQSSVTASPGHPAEMPVVDEDMRSWSFYQILEHNTIVNHRITGATVRLVKGEPPDEAEKKFNVKTDVMPAGDAGADEVEKFRASVEAHLEAVDSLANLKGTDTSPHTFFGPFDAHKWHCMFGFHLEIHRKQAEALSRLVLR